MAWRVSLHSFAVVVAITCLERSSDVFGSSPALLLAAALLISLAGSGGLTKEPALVWSRSYLGAGLRGLGARSLVVAAIVAVALPTGDSARADMAGEPVVVVRPHELDPDPELQLYDEVDPGGPLPMPSSIHPCAVSEDYPLCHIQNVALSPDGETIATLLYRTDNDPDEPRHSMSLVVMDADGSDRRTLWDQRSVGDGGPEGGLFLDETSLEFSPDALSLLVMGREPHPYPEPSKYLIFSVDSETGDKTILAETADPGFVGYPSWSADGSALVYVEYASDLIDGALVLETPEGEVIRRLETDVETPAFPTLSPDGTEIAFTGFGADGVSHVFVMDLESEAVRRLTDEADGEYSPRWSQDGKDVLYSAETPTYLLQLNQISRSGGTPEVLVEDVSLWRIRTTSDAYSDGTPPGLASNFDALLDGLTSEAHLRWDPVQDPREADGSRGSGVTGYLVRHRRPEEPWSEQTFTPDAEVIVPGSHTGEEIELEVRAQDANDNVGEPASDTVVVAAPATGDFDPPGLFAGDELAERDGGYVGAGEVALSVGADDEEGDGIARVAALAENGQQIASTDVDCTGGCPPQTEQTLSVDTATLEEGPTTIRIRGEDTSNNRTVEDAVDVYVDHTAPTAPTDAVVTEYNSSTGVAIVNWTEGADPNIASGLPGAGEGEALFRYRTGGIWSDWEEVEDGVAEVPGLSSSESFDIEVTSRDSVGNQSPVLAANLAAAPSDGAAYEPDASHLIGRSSVAGGAAEPAQIFSNCQVLLNRVLETNHGPLYQTFVPIFTKLHSRLRMYCHSVDSRFDSIRVRAALFVKTGAGNDPDDFKQLYPLSDPKALDVTFPVPDRSLALSGFVGPGADCSPSLGGDRRYLVAGTIQYIDNGSGSDPERNWDTGRGGPGPGPHTGTCPTKRIRRERELAGWRYLVLRSPDGQYKSTPRKRLGSSLGDRPWAPSGTDRAWHAHHIVPVKERGADDMRALMFRCHVHPNESINGVYLRGRSLRSDTAAYQELVEYDQDHDTNYRLRTYHFDTRGPLYPPALRHQFLRQHLKANREKCAIDNREPFRESLGDAKDALRVGNFGVETWR